MHPFATIALTLTIAALAAVLSYIFSFASSRLAVRFGAIDQPTGGRKIHRKPIPLFGGVGIALSIFASVFVLFKNGLIPEIAPRQLIGFAVAMIILIIGGITDDVKPRSPAVQIIFPILASLAVIVFGTGIIQVTNPTSVTGFSLVWWRYQVLGFGYQVLTLSLPADLITILWLLFAMYATKFLDGLDGLVAGMAVIGSFMIGALTLSTAYYQPSVALLTGGVGGAFLGFLPRNIHPAKQFLGEAGSTLAGFTLGFLAIVSGAKIAIALAVLAIPIADAALVVLGRLRRGASPWKGDATHLHFRLLNLGISHRMVVALLWGVSMAAGAIALTLQTRGKIFLLSALVVLTALASWMASRKRAET